MDVLPLILGVVLGALVASGICYVIAIIFLDRTFRGM